MDQLIVKGLLVEQDLPALFSSARELGDAQQMQPKAAKYQLLVTRQCGQDLGGTVG